MQEEISDTLYAAGKAKLGYCSSWIFVLLWLLPMATAFPNDYEQATNIGLGQPLSSSGLSPTQDGPALGFTQGAAPQLYSHGDPTDVEQLVLELINASRQDPVGTAAQYGIDINDQLAPGTIDSTAKQPLALNSALIQSARIHSQWMLDADIFSHTGENGGSPQDRMTDAGYTFTGAWRWAENIGWSGTTGSLNTEFHARQVIRGLFLSPGHRKNTLDERFNEIGIGALDGRFEGYNALMVTENFASSASTPTPMLVGVVYDDVNENDSYDIGEGIEGASIVPEGGQYYAVSSASGGYAIPLNQPIGSSINVTALLSGAANPVTKAVTYYGENIKLDFTTLDTHHPQHLITLTGSPLHGGVVTGGGIYNDGDIVNAIAEPRPGWTFTHWTEGAEQVSKTPIFAFTADRPRELTAHFADVSALQSVFRLLLDRED